ncbi:DNRLRE domain-containing protein [Streptomyces albidoflavus]
MRLLKRRRRAGRWRYATPFLLAALALEAGTASGAVGTRPAPIEEVVADGSDVVEAGSATARLRAGMLGERVEIVGLRTETSQTYANPDGSLTYESSTGPVRVQDDQGAWHPIDTTLFEQGGKIRPRRAATPISLPGGGDQPLVEVSSGKHSMGIGWEGELPPPSLQGNTATYREVSADTDLVVTVLPEGFSHHLVLRKRPTEPVRLSIPVTTKGLTLKETADSTLRWEDGGGNPVAAAPTPVMWDASENEASGEPGNVATVDASVRAKGGGQELILEPDQSFLDSPETVYPVIVDPTNTLVGPLTDTWVQGNAYPTSQRGSVELKAGTYNGSERARSFLKFNTAPYVGKSIVSASLRLYSHWSSTCSTNGAGIQARRITSDWDPSSIAWGSQPSTTTASAFTSKAAKGFDAACPAGHVSWNVSGIVQSWADGQANYGLRLAAADETDSRTWRRYHSANYVDGRHDASTEPSLTVTYNNVPDVPTHVAASPNPRGVKEQTVSSLTPVLSALVSDQDPGSSLTAEFQVGPDPAHGDTTFTWTGRSRAFSSESVASLRSPTLPDQRHLRVRARTNDGVDNSAWSGWLSFYVDSTTTAPADLPTHLQTGATQTPEPLLSGIVTSPSGGMVEARFRITSASGSKVIGSQTVPGGERAGFKVSENELAQGAPFTWSMQGCYEGKCSNWTDALPLSSGATEEGQKQTSATLTLPLQIASICSDADCTASATPPYHVGTVGGDDWTTYVKADLSRLPAGSRVISAGLRTSSSAPAAAVDVHALNAPWSETAGTTELEAAIAPGVNSQAQVPGTVDLTGLVTDWHDRVDENNGLALRYPEESSSAAFSFTAPSLVVEYIAPTAPSAPTAVTATPGDGGALVNWRASSDTGHNDALTTYRIQAVNANGQIKATVESAAEDAVITGLANGEIYTFRVTAFNPYGSSSTATSEDVQPVAVTAKNNYTEVIEEYFEATSAIMTSAANTAKSAATGKSKAPHILPLLEAEQEWMLNQRDDLREAGLRYTSHQTTVSDVLLIPKGLRVSVRAKISEKHTLHDGTSNEEELGESVMLFELSRGPGAIHRKMDARQAEQVLAPDDSAYGTVTHDTADPLDQKLPEGESPGDGFYLGKSPSRRESNYTTLGTIKATGTSNWAKKNWNSRHQYSQDCTNFVSKALHHGGGMRMKGSGKGKKGNDHWWRQTHHSPAHSGGGVYYVDSYTWRISYMLSDFFIGHSDGKWLGSSQSKAKVGDVVFFNWGGRGKWDHAGIITKVKGGKAYVTAHNKNRLNQSFDKFMKSERGTTAAIVRVKPGWY